MSRRPRAPLGDRLRPGPGPGPRPRPRPGVLALLAIGGIALVAIAAIASPGAFPRGYLFAWIFWLGMTVGSLSILLMQYLTGGRWGAVLIRVLEAGSSTLPLIAIGFVPLVLTLGDLYPWARGAAPAGSALAEKQAYLNPAFVVGRAIFYFLCWGFLTRRAIVLAREIGGIGEPPLRSRMKRFAGPGLVLLTFTATAGLIDWVMALEPAWYSTIYGAMVGTEMVLVALGFGTLVLSLLHARAPFDRVLEPRIWNDLGNMLLAFVMLRAYMAFSQGLLIWYGNLPEEVSWYLRRTRHGYGVLLAAIALLQFAVPFVALLWRAVKRHRRRLAAVASLLLVTGTADAWWIVAPPLRPETVAPAWTDIALLAGFGMVWVAVFLFALFREPLLRVDDPRLLPYAPLSPAPASPAVVQPGARPAPAPPAEA